MIKIQHLLSEVGHSPFFATKTLGDLGRDVKRVARFVEKTKADAWVVVSAPREVLEWFAARPEPAFALFGRRHNVKIASVGPETTPTISAVIQKAVRSFQWCTPPIAHFAWDVDKVARRVQRWAGNVSRGENDLHRTQIKAQFVEGGTIGPAKN